MYFFQLEAVQAGPWGGNGQPQPLQDNHHQQEQRMVDRVRRLGWGDHIFFHNIRDRQSLRVYHPCNHYHRWLRPPELRPDLMTGVLVKILGRKDHKNAKKSFIIVLTLERHSFYQKKRKTVRNVLTQLFLLPCIEERRHLWLSFNKGSPPVKKNVFFRALPKLPLPPPLPQIRAGCTTFFGRQKRRFSAYYRTK